MCIRENLYYVCGHSSVSVTRLCPMTTQHYTYPACMNQPMHTHVMRTMCGPCERLKHSRWVLIQEWEHRWMHERGACGCETVFPGLVGPRVARPVNGDFPPEKMDNKLIPPQFRFVDGPGAPASADGVRVEIRLSSVYGAEWAKDHKVKHQEGSCACPVSFDRYKANIPEGELTEKDKKTLERFRYMQSLDETRDAAEIDSIRKELAIPMYPNNTSAVRLLPSSAMPQGAAGYTPPASRDSEQTIVGAPAIAVGTMGNNGNKADSSPDTAKPQPANGGAVDFKVTEGEAEMGDAVATATATANANTNTNTVKYMTPHKPACDSTYMSPAYQGTLGEGPLPTTSMHLTDTALLIREPSASEPHTPSYVRHPAGNYHIETTGNPIVEDIKPPTNTLVGLPIGAGPEGRPHRETHASDFTECKLHQLSPRRSSN